jgi:hypothetical protein
MAPINVKELERSLEDQGFTVTREGSARGPVIVVKAPDGVNQNFFHKSSWETGTVEGVFNDLRKMGWKDPRRDPAATNGHKPEGPSVTKEFDAKIRKMTPVHDHPTSPMEFIPPIGPNRRFVEDWKCPMPGCTFKVNWPPSRGRHLKTGGRDKSVPAAEKPQEAPAPAPRPQRRVSPVTVKHVDPESPVVRFRNKMQQARAAREALDEALEWMLAEFERIGTENKDMKSRLKDLERILGKAVDRI